MRCPVVDGALAGNNSLHVETKHGEHSKTSVLDFLHLKLGEGIGVLSQVKGVEVTTGVERVKVLTKGTTVDTVSLAQTHKHNLGSKDGKDGLSMDKVGVAKVVKATVLEDLAAGLEPNRLAEADTAVLGKEFGGNTAKCSKHSPTAVD